MITLDPETTPRTKQTWVTFHQGRRLHALRAHESLALSSTLCGRRATGIHPPNAVAEAGMPRCECCCRRAKVSSGRGRPDLERLIRNLELARGLYRG